jgi:hypothetical protein
VLDTVAADRVPPTEQEAVRAAILEARLQALFIEDAHLLDEGAGALVDDLARSGTAVIANATGPGGMPAALRRLVEAERASIAQLEPLGHDEVVELAGHLLGDPVDAELGLALVTASQGRPRRLVEVVDDGVGTGSIAHADGLWRLAAPLPAARSLRAAVLDAFSTLPAEQRGWVAAIAQAGELADDLARRIAAPETILAVAESGWTERVGDRGAARIMSSPVATAVLGSLDVRARFAVLRRLVDAPTGVDRRLSEAEQVGLLRWRIELGERADAQEALAVAQRTDLDADVRELLLRAAVEGGAPAGALLADHLRRTRRPAEAHALIRSALPVAAGAAERAALMRVQTMTTGVVERRSADALDTLDAHLATYGADPDLLAVRAAMLLLEARPAESVRVGSSGDWTSRSMRPPGSRRSISSTTCSRTARRSAAGSHRSSPSPSVPTRSTRRRRSPPRTPRCRRSTEPAGVRRSPTRSRAPASCTATRAPRCVCSGKPMRGPAAGGRGGSRASSPS